MATSLQEVAYSCKNWPGLYRFYDSNGQMIYVGISRVLRHRLQSYLQKDDFNAHRTKRILRKHIAYVKVLYMPFFLARRIENMIKHKGRYNYA